GENLRLDNINNWSADNMQKVQTILEDCIPYIRFFQITSEDYYLKVYPFGNMLSSFENGLIAYYLAPKLYPKEKLEGYTPKRGKTIEEMEAKESDTKQPSSSSQIK
ncbi:10_t:CDS:2, partial [Ambispora leptoticha]